MNGGLLAASQVMSWLLLRAVVYCHRSFKHTTAVMLLLLLLAMGNASVSRFRVEKPSNGESFETR